MCIRLRSMIKEGYYKIFIDMSKKNAGLLRPLIDFNVVLIFRSYE